ncbi:MAG TPA: hypothetical protein VH682_29340 [Gemmataceae bacterium]|jgi:hypothetical protein
MCGFPSPAASGTSEETERVADDVYKFIWQRSASGHRLEPTEAA